LQFGEPICEWEIFGTPTTSGTYNFTVQIAPQTNNLGQTIGPDGYDDPGHHQQHLLTASETDIAPVGLTFIETDFDGTPASVRS
jgi:hypothetical protein